MKTIIIEVSGGLVQEVYTNEADLRIILVDWDKGDSPGDEYEGGRLVPQQLSAMSDETCAAVLDLTQ